MVWKLNYLALFYSVILCLNNTLKAAPNHLKLNEMHAEVKTDGVLLRFNSDFSFNCKLTQIFRAVNDNNFKAIGKINKGSTFFRDFIEEGRVKLQYYLNCEFENINAKKETSRKSDVVTVDFRLLLPKPQSLKAFFTQSNSEVLLQWASMGEILETEIWVKVGPLASFTKINSANLKLLQFRDKLRSKTERIFYKIRFQKKGEFSDYSDITTIKYQEQINIITLIKQPMDVTADYVNTYTVLQWRGLKDGQYKIWASEDNKNWQLAGQADCCKFYHLKVSLAKDYFYRVDLVEKIPNGNAQEKSYSSPVIKITTPYPKPSPVSGISARRRAGAIEVSWNSFAEADLAGFFIYFRHSQNDKWQKSDKIAKDVFNFTFRKAEGINEIYMTSVNKFGEESNVSQSISIE